MKTCSIDGCEKLTRTKSAALCKMHYHREYRNGTAGEAAERIRKQRSLHCEVDGCAKPDTEGGLCSMHAARMRRHGDTQTVIALSERVFRLGEDHHNWVGPDIGYSGAHCRVRALNGSASMHSCVGCGEQAQHWSYNHTDPSERLAHARSANPVAYSDNPEHYSARCVPCHKTFDLGRLTSRTVDLGYIQDRHDGLEAHPRTGHLQS